MFPPTYNGIGFFFPTLYAMRDIFSLGISLQDYFFPEITHSPPPPPPPPPHPKSKMVGPLYCLLFPL